MSDDLLDGVDEHGVPPADDAGLDALLDFLHRNRGFDFTGYKRLSLTRRILRRMQTVGLSDFHEYVDHLEVHPDEFPQLFNTLLINVTAFFRDAPAWEALSARLGNIVDLKGAAPIRVWSAGCSSGEEAYTLAMLLCEALGAEAFTNRVKIYATDVDEDALSHARQATYSQSSIDDVPPALAEKYFTRSGSNYVFNKDLRRAVIFGRHDLVQDAPIPRVDILSCRNALMYFNAETQTRILQRLQFAIKATGVLFLGKAEMLLTHADVFTPIDLKLRLFARVSRVTRSREKVQLDVPRRMNSSDGNDVRTQLQDASYDASPIAQIAIDAGGRLTFANHRVAQLFGLVAGDLGRHFHELELSYRPAELRSCLDKARLERRPIHLKEVERVLPSGERSYLDVEVVPLLSDTGIFLGTHVSFTDVTLTHRLHHELRHATSDLASAQEELQSTVEELETTNEELQSTNEELETTNEELQSTNEELETMNEELQSTNEELQTMNEELRQRGTDMNELNAFHQAVLSSVPSGLAVLDADLLVQAWNSKMEDLWGVRADEVDGKHFLNLDIGLPFEGMTTSIRASLADAPAVGEQVLDCTNRKGKSVKCRVSTLPLRTQGRKGVIVLVEEVRQ